MVSKKPIYLDFAATTPMDKDVLESLMPFFSDFFGNPSSSHYFGQRAEGAVEEARVTIAEAFKKKPEEIIFTSGGTESDNLALRGAALFQRKTKNANRIVTTPVEHPAVANTVRQLQDIYGFEVDYLEVDPYGLVDPEEVRKKLKKDTALVSVIYANNEIGSVNSIKEIGVECATKDVILHTDAVQAAAHFVIEADKEKIGLLSIGAHKFYGPKGVGALIKDRNIYLDPSQTGGKQENGLRAGTHNVPYIVGMAKALKNAQNSFEQVEPKLIHLRDHLIESVLSAIPEVKLTGHPKRRLSNHTSFVFQGIDGNQLIILLDHAGFACSSGSGCKTGNPQPSGVLKAIGIPEEWALGSLRVTLGKQTTTEEVDEFVSTLSEIIVRMRKIRS